MDVYSILEKSFKTGDNRVFHEVFKRIERLNLFKQEGERRGSNSGDVEKFISLFNELFFDEVLMEEIL